MAFWLASYECNCMIVSEGHVVYMYGILNDFVNVFMHSCPKEVAFDYGECFICTSIPACQHRVYEFTRFIKARDLGTIKASKDLSASCLFYIGTIFYAAFAFIICILFLQGLTVICGIF